MEKPTPKPKPDDSAEKPKIPSSANREIIVMKDSDFEQIDGVCFSFHELIFFKATLDTLTNERLLFFNVVDDFVIVVNELEFFLYQQELFERYATKDISGLTYMDVCFPDACLIKTDADVDVFMVINLLDNLEDLSNIE